VKAGNTPLALPRPFSFFQDDLIFLVGRPSFPKEFISAEKFSEFVSRIFLSADFPCVTRFASSAQGLLPSIAQPPFSLLVPFPGLRRPARGGAILSLPEKLSSLFKCSAAEPLSLTPQDFSPLHFFFSRFSLLFFPGFSQAFNRPPNGKKWLGRILSLSPPLPSERPFAMELFPRAWFSPLSRPELY